MIRLVTYSHFINSAQFNQLDGVKTFSRADVDKKINDWKKNIGYDDLSNSSKRLLDAISDSCMEIDWDYSDQMKRWLDASRKGNDIEELKPYCKEGQSVREFLRDKREELCNSTGVDSFTGSVINYEKNYAPWVQFEINFYEGEVADYISRENLSEQMGDCCHELDMVQKRRELKEWLNNKIASFNSVAEDSGMITQEPNRDFASDYEEYNR